MSLVQHFDEDTRVLVSKMQDSIEAHILASLKTAQDPDVGPFPAYPCGKFWDEAPGKTGSGKKFYHNVISGADCAAQPYRVGLYAAEEVAIFFWTAWSSAGWCRVRVERQNKGHFSCGACR